MIDGISAETLLADRGYDTNQIIAYAADTGMNIVIPAKRNRKQQREYDRYLYRLRHLVENAFLHLNVGEALLLDMQKLQHLFWLLCKFVALLFGVLFWLNLV